MPVDIQATGFVGIAFETTAGTYVAPTKFFPIRSESMAFTQDNQERRVIRGIADRLGMVAGPAAVEGDLEMEILHDVLPYLLYASRNTVVKTGAGPYTYTTTPLHGALPVTQRTVSVTVVKDGVAFAYTGCVVGSMSMTVDAGVLVGTFSLRGRDEASATVPAAPVFSSSEPFGHGAYTIGNPTGTTVFDVDTFTLNIEDNATSENRLSNTRGAQFVRFGERSVSLAMTRDFQDRTEYETWKLLTARSVTVAAASGANSVTARVHRGIKSAYNTGGLGTQGDLVRAEITYEGMYDAASSKAYEFIVVTTENIT
jgi:hypothetical protein